MDWIASRQAGGMNLRYLIETALGKPWLSIFLCNIYLSYIEAHLCPSNLLLLSTLGLCPVHLCIYAANTGATSAGSRSCANKVIFPFCLASAARTYSLTHRFTSVISGHWSRSGRLMVVSCVNPTPKLISSGSCSTIVSSVAASIGGFSSNLSKASQVYAQPFLYFSAKATESVRVLVKDMTAVFRSRGRKSFCVSGRMTLR